MKLSVSFNVFNGSETIYDVIKSYRTVADHISVVFQFVSNHGNPCEEKMVQILDRLKSEGYVDDILTYEPLKNYQPKLNELNKRNMGLKLAKEKGMTHFITADTDEFYDIDEFIKAKQIIEENDYDGTFCEILSYYKTPELAYAEDFQVPFIYKITDRVFEKVAPCKFSVDSSRKIKCDKPYKFKREEIQMHHLTFVRDDLLFKLDNASCNYAYKDKVGKMNNYFKNFKVGDQALIMYHAFEMRRVDLTIVEPKIELTYYSYDKINKSKPILNTVKQEIVEQPIQNISTNKKIDLSIVILSLGDTKERIKLTQDSINSALNNGSNLINKEIIIIESCLQAPSYSFAKTIYHKAEMFNYNESLNLGRTHCNGEYVAFCNNDLYFHEDWDVNLLTEMKKKKILSASPLSSVNSTYNKRSGIIQGYKISKEFLDWCFVMHKTLLKHIGPFPTDFCFHGADNIVADVLKKLNVKHYLICSSIVDHVEGGHKTWKNLKDKELVQKLTVESSNAYLNLNKNTLDGYLRGNINTPVNQSIKKYDLSIIVFSLDNKELTQNTLNSIRRNSCDNINKEIIVIENNKENSYDGCKMIYSEEELNFNQYCNLGINNSSGEYIAFCNNNLWFNKHWDKFLLNKMEEKNILSASPLNTYKKKYKTIYTKGSEIIEGYYINHQFNEWCFVIHTSVLDLLINFREDMEIVEELKNNKIKHYLICSSVVDLVN